MKTVLFSKKATPDPELLTLKAELLAAQGDLASAYRQFNQQLPDPGHQGAQSRDGRRRSDRGGIRMDLNQKIIAGILAGFFLIALLRVFSTPLRLVLKLLVNTLLGFAALWVVHLTAGFTGITLGLNLWNALVVAILGVPGFVLLLLIQWVL